MVMFDEDTKKRVVQLWKAIASAQRLMEEAVAWQEFEEAAFLRTQRDELRERLARLNLPPLVLRNLGRLAEEPPRIFPAVERLGTEPGSPDPEVVGLFPVPPESTARLAVGLVPSCPVATLSEALATDDIGSPYFRALLPVVSTVTLNSVPQTSQAAFIQAAFNEVRRGKNRIPIVVAVIRPSELDRHGLLDWVLGGLEKADCDFVLFENRERLAAIRSRIKVPYRILGQ